MARIVMIDTHCHLTYDGLHERVDAVVAAARAAGVDRMISVGTTPNDALRAIGLAERYESVFATAGVHPHYALQWTDRAAVIEHLVAMAAHPRIVAIGEMGLDRHYADPPLAEQQRILAWQLEVVHEIDRLQGVRRSPMPIIIHNREATALTLAALREAGLPGWRFVFHCFTGDDAELDAILDFGAMVSFTGIVTFRNSQALAAAARRVPLDRLMIETDAPYLTPEPHRKVRPNEPRYVIDVARFLASQRDMSVEAFTQAMDANAERFFDLNDKH